jgi:hypothetical protein
MKKLTLKQLIRKMYITRLIIPAVLLIAIIVILIINPFIKHTAPSVVKNLSDIDVLYEQNERNISVNVSVNIPVMYYTGVDYTENGKIKAKIFYTFSNDKCYFFLICKDKLKPDTTTLTDYSFNAHLTHNNNMYEAVIASMSEELNFSTEGLRNISCYTFVNQYDYIHSFESFLIYAIYIFAGIIFIDIILKVVVLFKPHLSIPFLKMRKYGTLKWIYKKAEKEFDNDVISFENKVFLSDHYIYGITYADNLEVALLEHLVWIYKNKDYLAKRNKEEITCTLCLVTDQKQLIKIPKVPEDICELLIRKIQKLHPQIMADEN